MAAAPTPARNLGRFRAGDADGRSADDPVVVGFRGAGRAEDLLPAAHLTAVHDGIAAAGAIHTVERHARQILGPKALIGLSVETWEDVERAESLDVDYLGVSPVFATPTKTDTKKPWGMEGLARIRAFSRHPLVAIGRLNAGNAAAAVRAGADAVAVVSAVCAAEDPREASRDLARIIAGALADRKDRS